MEILNNINTEKVVDKLKKDVKKGTKLSIISAYFTIYAYEELKKELNKIESLRLLFSEPTFIKEKKDINREFKLSGSYEKGLAGDRYEMKLKNELKQSDIAKECAEWIRNKVEVRSYDEEYPLPQKMYIFENENEESSGIMGSSDFTSSGLGIVPSNKPETNTYVKNDMFVKGLLSQFDLYWNDKDKVKDVKKELLNSLEVVYKENTPEFIYFVTIYNIFKEYLSELTEEEVIKSKTGFKDSVVWNKLYNFQKDGVLGAIDKLEKYNGCILADSVGLGKTFEALAIIKYYESRNNRVLVLCPKKLSENWETYKGNRVDNILEKDRLNYDILYHTDLSRYSGKTCGIDLSKVYWENYDLIVIDESHNFRNNSNKKDNKETRYSRLLNQVIKKGIKTKVLMLSATPVNNKMNDLKNQIAFATEGRDNALLLYGIKSIEQTLRKAQLVFNKWVDLPEDQKKIENLLESLETDYFKLLDMLTIARSRKHVQKYYDTSQIGKFPERLKPINIKSNIDIQNKFIELSELNKIIRSLKLAIYCPIKYVLPSKVLEYSKKYDTDIGKSVFRQVDREESLVHLMRINILKRMESSIYSFGITISRILQNIDIALKKLENSEDIEENFNIEEIDIDDNRLDSVLIGSKKIKVLLKDIDKIKWKAELEGDKDLLEKVLQEAFKINVKRDQKLEDLKKLIREKIENPINRDNKKIIIFTAFADTANYLYENISKYAKGELNLNTAVITGSENPKTTLKSIKNEFNTVLLNFSPKSKGRVGDEEEIDILIATDCISEGQNLQDCDYLVNYDIHWNPVRIIQRFGRIDRIGSKNKVIQLVNFWPNMELDEYINLEARVSGRMVMLDMSATGEENIIVDNQDMNDLEYRKAQLKQLQDQVIDLEDIKGGISITDLTFNDFKMDLVNYMKNNREIVENAPTGMYAIAKSNIDEAEKGVIFCLKQINKEIKPSEYNTLNPYFLVYIKENGEILFNFIQSKKILDIYKKVCGGERSIYPELIEMFNEETNNAKDMKKFTDFLEKTVENIVGKEEEKGIESLFSFNETIISKTVQNMDDFELISFLVIK